ncbi:MAG: 2OG-Fe(II) oxygenase [Nitrosomonas sp.]|uniref:2OG-Fe(II) oxygenase n=1 Tax=Nitrosomonas sp. TaxID=42353 RepID=UPI0027331CD6|nr:2OG-Fe(II) oxygenase [Nitrosomonas sp.]MDP3280439.1 2OG-Fe(II) oxygenase [Nitrosomonas sp.]
MNALANSATTGNATAGRVMVREPGLLVIDHVLPPPQFEAMARAIAEGEYRSVHSERHDRAWRPWDGTPLRAGSMYYDPGVVFDWQGPLYPSGTAVDPLIDRVRQAAEACPEIVGREGLDWIALYLSAWLYPVGSALSLHRDGDQYSGAFAFFAHRRWCAHWGGELLVQPPSARRPGYGTTWIADDGDDDDAGIATCVIPRPNRLVLLGPNRPHRIARVDANAGTHARASIAGFFLRPSC